MFFLFLLSCGFDFGCVFVFFGVCSFVFLFRFVFVSVIEGRIGLNNRINCECLCFLISLCCVCSWVFFCFVLCMLVSLSLFFCVHWNELCGECVSLFKSGIGLGFW